MAELPTDKEAAEAFKRMLGAEAEAGIADPPKSEPDEGEQTKWSKRCCGDCSGPSRSPEPIEGLAPKDKSSADYTPEERAAKDESLERTMRAKLEREERQRKEAEERFQAEANRSDAQRIGDAITESLQPGAKRARDAELIQSITSREKLRR